MIIKLEDFKRIGFLRISKSPDFSELTKPGQWDYLGDTPYTFGLKMDGSPYFDNWLDGEDASRFFDLIKKWSGEKRQLNVSFNGWGGAVFEIAPYPEDGEFH